MRIDVAGQVRIEDGERVLDESGLPGRQGRLVLVCLALHAGPVHRDVLADSLWPSGPPATWERTLSGVVSRLRSAISGAGFDDLTIANAFGCYELQRPGGFELDVDLSVAASEEAERALSSGDTAKAMAAASASADIARRPLLSGEEAGWIEAKRAELRAVLVRALDARAQAALGSAEAVAAGVEAVEVEPFRESSHLLLMRAHAALGNTAEALRTYERCRETLSDELGVDPSDELKELHLELLKLEEESAARSVVVQRERERRRRATGAIGRAIAHQRTSFIGRATDIDEVTNLMARSRLVTLTGPGGIGKTRLAVQVAAAADFDDVYVCDLSALRDPAGMARWIAEAVGAIDPLAEAGAEDDSDADAMEAHLLATLGEAEIVVVIDNCEHLLDRCARLCEGLLDSCPGIKVLATSREPLALAGEHVYLVHPLASPSRGDDVSYLARSEAVRLFDERARAVNADFFVSSGNAEDIARICRRLDGIPLAIELAAARVNALSPSEIAARLEDMFEILVSRVRTDPERHRTMEAAIEWSHRLLDAEEAVLLRRLAVFVGGFSLQGAERVCGYEPLDALRVPDLLTSLLEKSLVAMQTQGPEARYRLLEPLRQFAEAKLREAGEADEAALSHRSYLLELTAGVSWGLQVNRERLPAVIPELDNVSAALRWSVENEDASAAMQLAVNSYGVWRYVGRPTEARGWLASALATTDDRPSVLRGACLGFLGESLLHSGDVEAAHDAYTQALEIFRAREFAPGLGWTLLAIADTFNGRGDPDAMIAACNEAIDVFRRIADNEGLGWALANASGLCFSAGLLDESRSHSEACVDMGNSAPSETRARMQGMLGVLAAMQGDVSRGREQYETALRSLEDASRFELHWLSMMVGAFEVGYDASRDFGRARLSVALEIVRDGGVARSVPWILRSAAQCGTLDGRTRDAACLFGAAQTMLERFGEEPPFRPFHPGIAAAREACAEALADTFPTEYAKGAVLSVPSAADLCLDVLRSA